MKFITDMFNKKEEEDIKEFGKLGTTKNQASKKVDEFFDFSDIKKKIKR